MKTSLLRALCLLAIFNLALHEAIAQSPTWNWGRGVQSNPGYLYGNGAAMDLAGNSYVVGYSEPSCHPYFGTGDTLDGAVSPFIVKYDHAGIPQWAKTITGLQTGGMELFWSDAVDAQGNIIVAGTSNSPAIVAGSDTLLIDGLIASSNNYRRKIFLVKYDSLGNERWIKGLDHAPSIPNAMEEFGYKLAADGAGNCYLTGTLSCADPAYYWIFGNDTIYGSNFIAKFDSAGNAVWARPYGGMGVTVDPNGNPVVFGEFITTNSYNVIGSDTLYGRLFGQYFRLSYITKFTPSGSISWSQNTGGIYSQNYWNNGFFRGIASDPAGNVLIACDWADSLFIGSDTLVGIPNDGGSFPVFVAKYDAAGNFIWAVSDTTNIGFGIVNSVQCDRSGNVFVGGMMSGTIVKLDATGQFLWSNQTFAIPRSMAVDSAGELCVTGTIFDGIPCTFGSDTVYSSAGPIYYEGYFAALLGANNTGVGIPSVINAHDYSIYPNPFHDVLVVRSQNEDVGNNYRVFDTMGKQIAAGKLNASIEYLSLKELPAGLYFLQVDGSVYRTFRLVKE